MTAGTLFVEFIRFSHHHGPSAVAAYRGSGVLLGSNSVVDSLNRRAMQASVLKYRWSDELELHEKAALSMVSERVRNGRILDLGVGAGRTVPGLREISRNYVGVDYVEEMVDHCRSRFPGVRFEHADARAMPQFTDGSFDLIVFSCNGICMVDHIGRLEILREVHRLLAPGGFFVFSTVNLNSPVHHAFFAWPDFRPSRNPVRLLAAGAGFVGHLANRVLNRLRYKGRELRTPDYAILNGSHDYRTLLYCTTLASQRRQLEHVGFGSVQALDLSGHVISEDTQDDTLTLVINK